MKKQIKLALLLSIALLAVASPCMAQEYIRILDSNGVPISGSNPFPTGQSASGNIPADMTSYSSAMTTAAQTLTLTAASTHLTLTLSQGSSDLYIAFTGTAGPGNFILPGGFSLIYYGTALSDIRVKGLGSTGTKSLIAY